MVWNCLSERYNRKFDASQQRMLSTLGAAQKRRHRIARAEGTTMPTTHGSHHMTHHLEARSARATHLKSLSAGSSPQKKSMSSTYTADHVAKETWQGCPSCPRMPGRGVVRSRLFGMDHALRIRDDSLGLLTSLDSGVLPAVPKLELAMSSWRSSNWALSMLSRRLSTFDTIFPEPGELPGANGSLSTTRCPSPIVAPSTELVPAARPANCPEASGLLKELFERDGNEMSPRVGRLPSSIWLSGSESRAHCSQ